MRQLLIAMVILLATLRLYGGEPPTNRDTICLAETIYYEAGNQPIMGKVAVGFVVMNRAEHDSTKICKVVHEKIPGTRRCQFDWYCNATLKKSKRNANWPSCLEVARDILADNYEDPTKGATAFHAGFLKRRQIPKWARHMRRTYTQGNVFYAPGTPQRKRTKRGQK